MAPKKAASNSGTAESRKPEKAVKKVNTEVKKRKKARAESYTSYIYRVLKQVHPETGISNKSMMILNSFISDAFDKIATEAGKLCKYNKKDTLSSVSYTYIHTYISLYWILYICLFFYIYPT